MSKYIPPEFDSRQFHCPFCAVFAEQVWGNGCYTIPQHGHTPLDSVKFCVCVHCHQTSIWLNERMLHPDSGTAPLPHADMPSDVADDFAEARSIVSRSPRGAAALLRLAIQKLMADLRESGDNINADIKSLVSKGLPVQIQQALDAVRVIGNEAVHPGELDLRDTPGLAHSLFELVNVIVDVMIAQPRRIAEVYGRLPPDKVQAIQQRDGK